MHWKRFVSDVAWSGNYRGTVRAQSRRVCVGSCNPDPAPTLSRRQLAFIEGHASRQRRSVWWLHCALADRLTAGRSQKFVSEGDKTGTRDRIPPAGPGAQPWWGSGDEAPRS